jgi:predicted nucleic acid-binding protein
MEMVLVDTDVLVSYLRGNDKTHSIIKELRKDDFLCISPITISELYAGVRPHEVDRMVDLIASMYILDLTTDIAVGAGIRRNQYRRKGITLSCMDSLIAATAIYYNCITLTFNVKHFPGVELFKV